jgi:hypothetical protein
MSYAASVAGRFAREALAGGEGEVRALFRRSFYLRLPGERYACVGDASLGRGPLNALVAELELPRLGDRLSVAVDGSALWQPPGRAAPELAAIVSAADGHVPAEGFGCLVLGKHNALSGHAQPALEALERWLAGNAIEAEAQSLIGLGPGLTPSGDDYLAGMLIALHALGRDAQARGLWRWLQPHLAARTSAISAAHLEAAAAGEAHEVIHDVLQDATCVPKLAMVGHCSGWDALAGVVAVLRSS